MIIWHSRALLIYTCRLIQFFTFPPPYLPGVVWLCLSSSLPFSLVLYTLVFFVLGPISLRPAFSSFALLALLLRFNLSRYSRSILLMHVAAVLHFQSRKLQIVCVFMIYPRFVLCWGGARLLVGFTVHVFVFLCQGTFHSGTLTSVSTFLLWGCWTSSAVD